MQKGLSEGADGKEQEGYREFQKNFQKKFDLLEDQTQCYSCKVL